MKNQLTRLVLVGLVVLVVGFAGPGTASATDVVSDPNLDKARPTNPKGAEKFSTGFVTFVNGAEATTDRPCLKEVNVNWTFPPGPPATRTGRVCILEVNVSETSVVEPGQEAQKGANINVTVDTSHIPAGTTYTITETFVNDDGSTEDVVLGPYTK